MGVYINESNSSEISDISINKIITFSAVVLQHIAFLTACIMIDAGIPAVIIAIIILCIGLGIINMFYMGAMASSFPQSYKYDFGYAALTLLGYLVLTSVSFFIVGVFAGKIHEKIENNYLFFISLSFCMFCIIQFITHGKLLKERVVEVINETEFVNQYADSLIYSIKNEGKSYGFAVNEVKRKKLRPYYTDIALCRLKDDYVKLDSEQMIADFKIFLDYKKLHPKYIDDKLIYFPTQHTHSGLFKSQSEYKKKN